MTTTNHTTATADRLHEPSVTLKDAVNWAENIVNTAINMRAHTKVTGAALHLWETAVPLFEYDRWSSEQRLALRLSLDALLLQPDVLIWMVQQARDHLVKTEAAEDQASALNSTPAPGSDEPAVSLHLRNLTLEVDSFIAGAITGGLLRLLPPAAAALFTAGSHLVEGERDSFEQRAGHFLNLTALLKAPGALDQVAENLRSALLDADPQLGSLAGEIIPMDPPPSVMHDFDGMIIDLCPDGRLELSRSAGRGTVGLDLREAYALLTFMRLPAVVALLEAQDAAWQTEREASQQEGLAEEAAKVAAGAYRK